MSLNHPQQQESWVDKLRELYLSEDPDGEGYRHSSILFNWGKFTFERNSSWGGQIRYYLTTQDAIEEFIAQTISSERQRAFDEGYKKGVADEVECIETSGEHSEAVKKIRQRVLEEVMGLVEERKIKGIVHPNTPESGRNFILDDLLSAIEKLKEKYADN